MYTVAPTLTQVYTALKALIVSATGLAPAAVVHGLVNRAAMPLPGFIQMQELNWHRLRTNLHTWSPSDPAPTTLAIEQGRELVVQIDCYGPMCADWAAILTTILRDNIGCEALAPYAQPLYADDARQIPLVNGEEQYERRESLDAHLQVNSLITVPQQYANELDMTVIDVQEAYPA
jgi:hypothetical protein